MEEISLNSAVSFLFNCATFYPQNTLPSKVLAKHQACIHCVVPSWASRPLPFFSAAFFFFLIPLILVFILLFHRCQLFLFNLQRSSFQSKYSWTFEINKQTEDFAPLINTDAINHFIGLCFSTRLVSSLLKIIFTFILPFCDLTYTTDVKNLCLPFTLLKFKFSSKLEICTYLKKYFGWLS